MQEGKTVISNSRLNVLLSRMPRITAAIPPREPVSLGPITSTFMRRLLYS